MNTPWTTLLLDDARGVGGSLGRQNLMRSGEAFIDALGRPGCAALSP